MSTPLDDRSVSPDPASPTTLGKLLYSVAVSEVGSIEKLFALSAERRVEAFCEYLVCLIVFTERIAGECLGDRAHPFVNAVVAQCERELEERGSTGVTQPAFNMLLEAVLQVRRRQYGHAKTIFACGPDDDSRELVFHMAFGITSQLSSYSVESKEFVRESYDVYLLLHKTARALLETPVFGGLQPK